MGKKDVRVIPWKYVVTMQFVITASCVSCSVRLTQYVLPFSPYFIHSCTGLSMDEVGYVGGSLLATYMLGRSAATPFWIYVADVCGRRAVLSMCFMFSLVLTMFFGLCSTLATALAVRFCLGLFAPVYCLAQSILRELASPCLESMPSVAVVTNFNVIASHALGLFVGAFMVPDAAPAASSDIQKFVFLSPSLVSAAVTLFAFIAFFVDFPETLPLAVELQKKAKQAASKPAAKNLPGKYVELAETGNGQTEDAKQDTHGDVLTERKEHIEDDEDIPNYLMHFAQQRPSVENSDEAQEKEPTLSTKLARFFSPKHADAPKVSLNPRPNTARANTFAHPLPEIDEPKEPVAERRSHMPVSIESKQSAPTNEKEEIKRTHISFFEEDFDPSEVSSAASPQSPSDISLEDKHRRKPSASVWRSPAFRYALAQFTTLTFLTTAIRYAAVIWLVADTPELRLSVGALGLVLLVSASVGELLHAALMSRVVFFHPVNQYAVFTCVSLAMVVTALPFADYAKANSLRVALAVVGLVGFEYLSSTLLTIEALKLGDSVSPELRESALRWSSCASGVFKAAAVLLGPAVLSASLAGHVKLDYHYLFAAGAGTLVLFSAFLAWDRRHFPRFDTFPYEV